MRLLIAILLVFSSSLIFAQEKDSAPKSVKKGKINSEYKERSAAESESIQNSTRKASLENDQEEISQSVQIQSNNASFQLSRNQATNQRTQRSPSAVQQNEMNRIVMYFERNLPESFEHHYYTYVAGNHNVELIGHLKKAEKIRPESADVHSLMAAYNLIVGSKEEANRYLQMLVADKRLLPEVIAYSEDVLLSVPKNGILLTHGFDDAYGAWYAQQMNGVREDVKILSLEFMQSLKYRTLLSEEGLSIPDAKVIDVDFFKNFCSLNSSKNVTVSLTTPKEYFMTDVAKFYLFGLVYAYRESAPSNFDKNEVLWNRDLKKHLISDASSQKAKNLSSNYLPMLFQLRKVYNKQGHIEKVKNIDAAIDKIGAQSGKYEKVQKLKGSY